MLTSFVRHKLALLAVPLPLAMLAYSRSFALFAVVLLAIVLANATALAFFAKISTMLMNALRAVSTLLAASFVVNALPGSTAFGAVPFILTVWTIWKHRIAWSHHSFNTITSWDHFVGGSKSFRTG